MLSSNWLLFVLTLGIMFLGIYWIYTTPKRVNFFQEILSLRLLRLCLTLLAVGLSVISTLNFPIPKHESDNTIIPLGLFLYCAGAILAIWAKNTMNEVWGVPNQHDFKRQNKLLTDGPFQITRNPIYTGALLVFVGFTLATKSWLIFFTPVYYFWALKVVKKEESLLEKYFGKQYTDYKSKVPRFLGLAK